MSKRVLVFDFGASGARAMMCGFDGEKITLEEIHRFPNEPIHGNGRIYWDIDELFEQMKIGISFGVFGGGFDAISIDTWGVDFGLIDSAGELLGRPVHYRDERTKGIPEIVYKSHSAESLFMESGVLPQNINTMFQLQSTIIRGTGELFRAEKLLMMPDLFAYLLTGECRNEYTEATTTGLIEKKSRGWNLRLIESLGLPKRIFCPIIHAGEYYGMLKREIADEFRCEPVPVIACPSHDTASAVTAVPSEDESFAFISCGTWALFGTELRHPIVTKEAMDMGLTNEGGYGDTSILVKNIMGMWLIQQCREHYNAEAGRSIPFSELEQAAREAKPFVTFLNPNDEAFKLPGDMPLKIKEYCRETGQPVPESMGEVLRCVYDSLACEFTRTLRSIEKLTEKRYDKLFLIGGGSKDGLLCELTAGISDRVVSAGPSEATALGNGISSLIALGEIASVAEARRLIIKSGLTREYSPKASFDREEVLGRYLAVAGG